MTTINSWEAQAQLPQLLERVAKGEKIVITKDDQPAAMLVPPPPEVNPDVKKVIEEFKAYSKRQGRTLGGITFRELIDEGRRY